MVVVCTVAAYINSVNIIIRSGQEGGIRVNGLTLAQLATGAVTRLSDILIRSEHCLVSINTNTH